MIIFQELIKTLNEYDKDYKFDSLYYTFKPKKGFRVIVLDGSSNEKSCSEGYIPPEELLWLDEVLKKSKKDVVLIFIHFPVLPPFDSKNHEITNVNELKNVLSEYDMPMGIFSGHYHMTKITKKKNTVHVSTPSLAGYPNAFRIIKVIKKRNKTIFEINLEETGLKDIQKKAKITALGGSVYYGREKDRNNIVVLEKRDK